MRHYSRIASVSKQVDTGVGEGEEGGRQGGDCVDDYYFSVVSMKRVKEKRTK